MTESSKFTRRKVIAGANSQRRRYRREDLVLHGSLRLSPPRRWPHQLILQSLDKDAHKSQPDVILFPRKFGADEGLRILDFNLGNEEMAHPTRFERVAATFRGADGTLEISGVQTPFLRSNGSSSCRGPPPLRLAVTPSHHFRRTPVAPRRCRAWRSSTDRARPTSRRASRPRRGEGLGAKSGAQPQSPSRALSVPHRHWLQPRCSLGG